MLTFDTAYAFTSKISSHTAYSDAESRLLFDLAMETPQGGVIVEIGCEYGRSTSLLMQVAMEKQAELHLVEPDPKPELLAMLTSFQYPFIVYVSKSEDTYGLPDAIDFLHIDGAHEYAAVTFDLNNFVKDVSGWTVCHDFNRESLPDVTKAINEFVHKTTSARLTRKIAETALGIKLS